MSSSANKYLPAQVWVGMSAQCVNCGQLIVVVDAYEDYPELHTSELEWRHASGYYACNNPGTLPQAEGPDLNFEPAWQGHPTERVPDYRDGILATAHSEPLPQRVPGKSLDLWPYRLKSTDCGAGEYSGCCYNAFKDECVNPQCHCHGGEE